MQICLPILFLSIIVAVPVLSDVAQAKCRVDGPLVTDAMADAFLKRPNDILSFDMGNVDDNQNLSRTVASYVVARSDMLSALVSVLPSATAQQKRIIGQTLYQTIETCRAMDPSFASMLWTAVNRIDDEAVRAGYRKAQVRADELFATNANTLALTPSPPGQQSLIGDLSGGGGLTGSLDLQSPFSVPSTR